MTAPDIYEYREQLYDERGEPFGFKAFRCVKLSEYEHLRRVLRAAEEKLFAIASGLDGVFQNTAPVAQSEEHTNSTRGVAGSSPAGSAT